MLRVALNMIDIEAVGLEVPQRLLTEAIVADTAGHDGAVAEQGSDISKICGSAAELLSFGKKVPQKFAEANHQRARIIVGIWRRHRLANVRVSNLRGTATARRVSVRVRRLRRDRGRDRPGPEGGAECCYLDPWIWRAATNG